MVVLILLVFYLSVKNADSLNRLNDKVKANINYKYILISISAILFGLFHFDVFSGIGFWALLTVLPHVVMGVLDFIMVSYGL